MQRRATWVWMLLFALLLFLPAAVQAASSGHNKPSGASQKGKEKDKGAKPSSFAGDASQYVGSDTCAACHDAISKNFSGNPHWQNEHDRRGVQWQGCEACHGAGKAHAESGDPTKILKPASMPREESSRRCLECHDLGPEHANFTRSQHARNHVGCIDCHSVHAPRVKEKLMKGPQPEMCYGCHQDVRPAFSKPFHHRVDEGLMRCTDCHNPHGGFLTPELRTTAQQDVVCFRCHTDKAGPFAFEHAPVKTDGCTACHSVHGSINPRMLKRSQVNLLCLECHTFVVDSAAPAIPSFHNQSQKYAACTLCHVAIHGSNTDRFLFKP